MKWNGRMDAGANARQHLPTLASEYFAECRKFLEGDFEPRELHRLRLASKKFRYTLELFRPCYPAGMEERIDQLKKVQDLLGEVNDAVASGKLLRGQLKDRPKEREFFEKRAAERGAEFVRHWRKGFDAPGQEAWWTEFLARKARVPKDVEK